MQQTWNRSVIEEEFGGNANGLEKAGPGAAIESLVKPHGANISPLPARITWIFRPAWLCGMAARETLFRAGLHSSARPSETARATQFPPEREKYLDMVVEGMVSKSQL
jgi:hypothetical protein